MMTNYIETEVNAFFKKCQTRGDRSLNGVSVLPQEIFQM